MSWIETRVNARLRGSTALVALVGDEIRTAQLESTGPGVTSSLVSMTPDRAFGTMQPWVTSRIQVTARAKTFGSVHEIARLARKRMERWAESTVRDTLFENELHFPPTAGWYEIVQDYLVFHTT